MFFGLLLHSPAAALRCVGHCVCFGRDSHVGGYLISFARVIRRRGGSILPFHNFALGRLAAAVARNQVRSTCVRCVARGGQSRVFAVSVLHRIAVLVNGSFRRRLQLGQV